MLVGALVSLATEYPSDTPYVISENLQLCIFNRRLCSLFYFILFYFIVDACLLITFTSQAKNPHICIRAHIRLIYVRVYMYIRIIIKCAH